MAITRINVSDKMISLVTKTNVISTGLGDVDNLITGDSNVVDAINTVRDLVTAFDDSAEIVNITRNAFSASNLGGDGSISYNSSTGVISYTGPDAADVRAHFSADSGLDYDSALGLFTLKNLSITNAHIANDTITSTKFSSLVSFSILDEGGTTLKTIYSPGS